MRQYPTTGGYFSLTPRQGRMRTPLSAVPSDTTAPAITSVTASAGTYYFVGRTITFTVTFSEAVTVTGTPRIALTIGAATRYATYTGGTGTTTLTFAYTFVVGDTDTDGFAATSPIELNSGTIKDAAGNNATLTFSAPSMTAKRAVLRGVTVGTDFAQGADSQKVYNVLDGTTISASTGVRGSGTGSDAADPTFSAHGATYDGGDYFSSAMYESAVDTTTTWSIHARFYFPTGGSHVIFNSADASFSGGMGCWCIAHAGKIYFINSTNVSSGSGDGGYRAPGIAAGAIADWYTVSLVSSAAGAGGVKVYVNGTQTGTITGGTASGGAQTDLTQILLGWTPNGGVYSTNGVKSRGLAVCTVAHTDAEVTAIHAFFEYLDGSINGDTTAPTVSNALFSNVAGDTYDSSQGTLNLDVVFTEAVTVAGTPQITITSSLAVEGFPKTLNYTSGTGTTTIRFAYAIDAADDSGSSDLKASSTSALALNGGSIRDANSNAATLTLPAALASVRIGGSNGDGIRIVPGP